MTKPRAPSPRWYAAKLVKKLLATIAVQTVEDLKVLRPRHLVTLGKRIRIIEAAGKLARTLDARVTKIIATSMVQEDGDE